MKFENSINDNYRVQYNYHGATERCVNSGARLSATLHTPHVLSSACLEWNGRLSRINFHGLEVQNFATFKSERKHFHLEKRGASAASSLLLRSDWWVAIPARYSDMVNNRNQTGTNDRRI